MSTTIAVEAGTPLPQLMELVATGESITITRQGIAIASIMPAPSSERSNIEAVVEELLKFREEHRLTGKTVTDLLEEFRPV